MSSHNDELMLRLWKQYGSSSQEWDFHSQMNALRFADPDFFNQLMDGDTRQSDGESLK